MGKGGELCKNEIETKERLFETKERLNVYSIYQASGYNIWPRDSNPGLLDSEAWPLITAPLCGRKNNYCSETLTTK